MTTLLAHIKIKPSAEAQWEVAMHELVENTLASESEVIRYEYWKGQEPGRYYGLLSFTSKLAFFEHQDADYHRNQTYGDIFEDIHLEFLDPVNNACPLPSTRNLPLPDDASPGIREWEKRTPVVIADWWQGRA